MDMVMALLVISGVIWYIIDRFKELWSGQSWSKYVTIGFVAVLSSVCVFSFGLDILVALNVSAVTSVVGEILTTLVLMTGSSAISEILNKVKQPASTVLIESAESVECDTEDLTNN